MKKLEDYVESYEKKYVAKHENLIGELKIDSYDKYSSSPGVWVNLYEERTWFPLPKILARSLLVSLESKSKEELLQTVFQSFSRQHIYLGIDEMNALYGESLEKYKTHCSKIIEVKEQLEQEMGK